MTTTTMTTGKGTKPPIAAAVTDSADDPTSGGDRAGRRPLSAAELFAWRSFVETVSDLSSALESDLAPTGLTIGDYQVLVYLSEAEGRTMRMCDLAAKLQLSPSGLTRRLDGLVRNGYVDRRPSGVDRRVMLAVLTDAGVTKLAETYPVHLASVRDRVIDRLDHDDVESFGRIFSTIRTALGAGRHT